MKKRMWLGGGLLLLSLLVLIGGTALYLRGKPPRGSEPPIVLPAPDVVVPQAPPAERPSRPEPPEPAQPPAPEPPAQVDELPIGKLVITPERKEYTGGLTLTIPALSLSAPVLNGTNPDVLRQGIGLFDYAQLPGEGNRNVSLAGHRNGRTNGKVTDNAPLYYMDTLTDGDYLYLSDSTNIYRYLYDSTTTVEQDDWSVICTTGSSCITVTSCTPIGISDHRIIVRGLLDEIFPFTDDFNYLSHSKEVPS